MLLWTIKARHMRPNFAPTKNLMRTTKKIAELLGWMRHNLLLEQNIDDDLTDFLVCMCCSVHMLLSFSAVIAQPHESPGSAGQDSPARQRTASAVSRSDRTGYWR